MTNQETTISGARKNVCDQAIWEMEELAEMIACTEVADGNMFAIRGIARRIGHLTYVMARAMDDKGEGVTEELEIELLGTIGADRLREQRAAAGDSTATTSQLEKGVLKMSTQALTPAAITHQIHVQYERLQMLLDLARMAIKALPNSTDSDEPRGLLTGMSEILASDFASMYRLYERMTHQASITDADKEFDHA